VSFFDAMKRMMEGKPAFVGEDEAMPKSGEESQTSPKEPQTGIRKGDESSFPVVYVKRTKTTLGSRDMQVYCIIANTWPEEIMLDKIRLGGVVRELDTYLNANQEREFLVYSGPRLNRQEFEAQLDYKTQHEGDYFRAVHDVSYAYHNDDKTYSVSEVRLRRPILDIYG
jgi:hypothetical protein